MANDLVVKNNINMLFTINFVNKYCKNVHIRLHKRAHKSAQTST